MTVKTIDTANARFWTEDKIAKASTMWNDGVVSYKIAEAFGVSRGSLSGIAVYYRDLFPSRVKPKIGQRIEVAPIPVIESRASEPTRRTYIAGKWVDHVKRKTTTGAVVTMPRVSFIDGLRETAD